MAACRPGIGALPQLPQRWKPAEALTDRVARRMWPRRRTVPACRRRVLCCAVMCDVRPAGTPATGSAAAWMAALACVLEYHWPGPCGGPSITPPVV